MSEANGSNREYLEQRANVVRARMMGRLDELDQRRQDISDTVTAVELGAKRWLPAAVGVGSAVLVLGLIVRARRQRDLSLRARRLLTALLTTGEEATGVKPPGALPQFVKRAAMGILLRVAQRAAQRYYERHVVADGGAAAPAPEGAPARVAL